MTAADARCVQGERCTDAIEVRDEAGGFVERQGVLLSAKDNTSGLCRACCRDCRDAITALPRDWELLEAAKLPATTQRLRDPDIPAAPRIKLHSPAPLNIHPWDVQLLIVAEATTIASALFGTVGTGWGSGTDEHAQITATCAFLTEHFDTLLALPDTAQTARSAAFEPWQGHPPDRLACAYGAWWVWRTGVEMAVRLWDLHHDAARLTGSAEGDVILPVPCPACRRSRSLVRDHAFNRVRCRRTGCDFMRSDDEYDRMRSAAPSAFLAMADQLADAA